MTAARHRSPFWAARALVALAAAVLCLPASAGNDGLSPSRLASNLLDFGEEALFYYYRADQCPAVSSYECRVLSFHCTRSFDRVEVLQMTQAEVTVWRSIGGLATLGAAGADNPVTLRFGDWRADLSARTREESWSAPLLAAGAGLPTDRWLTLLPELADGAVLRLAPDRGPVMDFPMAADDRARFLAFLAACPAAPAPR